jgi:hypothetical protein
LGRAWLVCGTSFRPSFRFRPSLPVSGHCGTSFQRSFPYRLNLRESEITMIAAAAVVEDAAVTE